MNTTSPSRDPATLRVLIIGRGRMGQMVREQAERRGHIVVDLWGRKDLQKGLWPKVDVAIDFTLPESALEVFAACRDQGVPLVSGTTGWESHRDAVEEQVREGGHRFLWSPNFSVGVHLFRRALAQVQKELQGHEFSVRVDEVHHTGKKDAPSGTAIALAQDLKNRGASHIEVGASRLPGVPGTHTVSWDNKVDRLVLEHSAKDRSGFGCGAVQAAEWLVAHDGPFNNILGMEDVWG